MADSFEQPTIQSHRYTNNVYMDLQCTHFTAHTTLSLSLHSPKHSTISPVPGQPLPTHTPSIIRFHRIHHDADIRSTYCVVISSPRPQYWSRTWAGRGRPEEGNKSAERSCVKSVRLTPFYNISLFNLGLRRSFMPTIPRASSTPPAQKTATTP